MKIQKNVTKELIFLFVNLFTAAWALLFMSFKLFTLTQKSNTLSVNQSINGFEAFFSAA